MKTYTYLDFIKLSIHDDNQIFWRVPVTVRVAIPIECPSSNIILNGIYCLSASVRLWTFHNSKSKLKASLKVPKFDILTSESNQKLFS